MKSGADRTHRTCVEAFGFEFNSILECAENSYTYMQQMDFERLTTPMLKETNWVPTILYNRRLTKDSHTGQSPNLKNNLCELFGTHPLCEE